MKLIRCVPFPIYNIDFGNVLRISQTWLIISVLTVGKAVCRAPSLKSTAGLLSSCGPRIIKGLEPVAAQSLLNTPNS